MIDRARSYLSGPGLGPVLVKAVIGSAGLRVAGMGFAFLVGVQLARGLGAEGYGVYGLAMSIIALLTVPTEFGLPQLLTREVAAAQATADWGRLRGVLRWASRAVLLTSLAVGIVVVVWLLASGKGTRSPLGMTLLAGLVMVPLVACGNLNGAALRGLQHIVKGQLADALIRPLLFSLLLFVVPSLLLPLNPPLAMGLGVTSAALALLVSVWMLRREMPEAVSIPDVQIDARHWWSSALPMALTEGMRVLQAHVSILLLGVMSTVAMVGLYRVASSVALLVAVPITLLNVVSAPIISRLHAQGDRGRLQRMLAWIALGMSSSSALLATPFLIAGERVIGSVFGAEFSGSNPALLVLCAGVFMNGLFGANAALLNMTGHQRRVTRASLISLIMLALLSPVLIARFDILGAALAGTLALTAWNLLMWRDASRLLGLDTSFRPLLKNRNFRDA